MLPGSIKVGLASIDNLVENAAFMNAQDIPSARSWILANHAHDHIAAERVEPCWKNHGRHCRHLGVRANQAIGEDSAGRSHRGWGKFASVDDVSRSHISVK